MWPEARWSKILGRYELCRNIERGLGAREQGGSQGTTHPVFASAVLRSGVPGGPVSPSCEGPDSLFCFMQDRSTGVADGNKYVLRIGKFFNFFIARHRKLWR